MPAPVAVYVVAAIAGAAAVVAFHEVTFYFLSTKIPFCLHPLSNTSL
jgi:hypothetical protein